MCVNVYIYIYIYRPRGRVFANGPGDRGSILACHTEDSKNGY